MDVKHAANRLHHISMLYSGAIAELGKGEALAFIPQGYPGLSHVRDLIDLVLLCRAEINALTKILVDEGMDMERFEQQVTEEYEWLAQQKAERFGCEVEDHGLVFKKDKFGQRR